MIRKPKHIEYWQRDYMPPREPAPPSRRFGWLVACWLALTIVAFVGVLVR